MQRLFKFVAVERYMSCGLGICGKCEMDGHRTCVDGPVFPYEAIEGSASFGNYHRDKTGKKEFFANLTRIK